MNKIIIYVEILKKTKGEKKILELIVSLATSKDTRSIYKTLFLLIGNEQLETKHFLSTIYNRTRKHKILRYKSYKICAGSVC